MRVPRGVSYILYIQKPENPQSPCKPHWWPYFRAKYSDNIPGNTLGATCTFTLSIGVKAPLGVPNTIIHPLFNFVYDIYVAAYNYLKKYLTKLLYSPII